MQYAYKDIGGYRLYMRTYEGTLPGPTLRLKPGDVLRIKLTMMNHEDLGMMQVVEVYADD